MKFDIAREIEAVFRKVYSCEHEGGPARVIAATRTYDADVEDVWDALTSADRIPRWLLPITGDFHLGGRFQLTGNAGGEIQRCKPPRLLTVTWELEGTFTWVRIRLADDPDGGTRLEFEHIARIGDDPWNHFGPGILGVRWDFIILGLSRYIEPGSIVDRKTAASWAVSAEGKMDFVRRSSADWCRASIAAGTDEAMARAAAKRTTAICICTGAYER
jgi:hypothetical protein